MKSFLKYLLIILISSSVTIVALMQIAPLIILVPNKDTQEIEINFDQLIELQKGGLIIFQPLINFPLPAWLKRMQLIH